MIKDLETFPAHLAERWWARFGDLPVTVEDLGFFPEDIFEEMVEVTGGDLLAFFARAAGAELAPGLFLRSVGAGRWKLESRKGEGERELATVWISVFGTANPLYPREVIDLSFYHRSLRAALERAIPLLADHPHPQTLATWLADRENLPIDLGDRSVRWARHPRSHRWRLVEVGV